jgi:hypothetical protein
MKESHDDCCGLPSEVSRRNFLATTVGLAATGLIPAVAKRVEAAPTKTSAAETAVKALFDTFTPEQKKEVCFSWDHIDKDRGLLRSHVSNNWQITKPTINGGFYTKKQIGIIHDVYKGLINPEWYARFEKQLKDDNAGKPWGTYQSLAIFGEPGSDKFECVITGRHQTIRADGNTEAHVAFGGPIFYGHAAQDFNEKADHPGNVFWPQAQAANKVYKMLDEKQKKLALVDKSPRESQVAFKGSKLAGSPGIAVKELSKDQKAELQKVLMLMVEPFRKEDQEEALRCLKVSGGLDACVLSFFENSDIGDDGIWDNWRLEGPSQVWYFRGDPHVHVWVNVADSPEVKLNARG